MEYKKSKYTKVTRNKSGELILYNTYNEINSLVKLSKKSSEHVTEDGMGLSDIKDSNIVKALIERGHLVPVDENEDSKLKSIYFNVIDTKVLDLTILPTEQCNFACGYCYESFQNHKMNEDVIQEIIKFVDRKMRTLERLHVSWFGGEPTMALDVVERLSLAFVDICKKYRKIYEAEITTNGYLLNLNNFNKLLSLRVLTYQITIDGDEEIHNKQRPLKNGKGSFLTIMNHLRDIKNNVKSRRFRIILRTNCTRTVLETIREYFDYIEREFGDDSRFGILIRPVMDWGGERVIDLQDDILEYRQMGQVYEILSEYNLASDIYKELLKKGGQVCYAAKRNQYCFNTVGQVFKCTCDLDNKQGALLGEIQDYSLDKYEEWIADFRYDTGTCKECFYQPICMKDWCPSKRIHHEISGLCPIDYYTFNAFMKFLDKKQQVPFIVGEEQN